MRNGKDKKSVPPPLSSKMNVLSGKVVDSAYVIHKALGPGLLENVYEICLTHELKKKGLKVERQVEIPINYDGIKFDAGFRIDLLVEDHLIIELKAAEAILSVHEAQLLTYLKLCQKRLGLLINFNVPILKEGIKRIIL
jgi:GxxExxY protein